MTGKVIQIHTYGERLGAARPDRRYLYIEYNLPLKEIEKLRPLFKYNGFIRQFQKIEYVDYVKGFCKYCKVENDTFIPCLRHDSVIRIPFKLSNHDYYYTVVLTPTAFRAAARVGASGWRFRAKIEGKTAEATIRRPSGTAFTYRAEGENEFKIYNVEHPKVWLPWTLGTDELLLSRPRSVFYLLDDFVRWIGKLMNPFNFIHYCNVYVITPNDEFLIPVHPD
ncbi:MAG: hypothetical protein QXH81_03425 [Thermofilaceae archaeon]